jgi:hypothetical protein
MDPSPDEDEDAIDESSLDSCTGIFFTHIRFSSNQQLQTRNLNSELPFNIIINVGVLQS